jgi:nucleotide-binding universal stress UspA family protein
MNDLVCVIENPEVSRSTAQVAAALARELDSELVLAHVADGSRRDAIRAATPMLESVAATLSATVSKTRVLVGDPIKALAAVAREEDAAFVIMGESGGDFSRLADTAGCPLLVVPSDGAADRFLAQTRTGRLVCGLDDAHGSLGAWWSSAGLAEHMELELLPRGMPVEELGEHALEAGASAIVVGARGRGTALGSVSAALAASAPVPVFVVGPSAQMAHLRRNFVRQVGRFSDGLERFPERTGRRRQGRFSDGMAKLPAKLHRGRFSQGMERLPETATTQRRGSFADGYDVRS